MLTRVLTPYPLRLLSTHPSVRQAEPDLRGMLVHTRCSDQTGRATSPEPSWVQLWLKLTYRNESLSYRIASGKNRKRFGRNQKQPGGNCFRSSRYQIDCSGHRTVPRWILFGHSRHRKACGRVSPTNLDHRIGLVSVVVGVLPMNSGRCVWRGCVTCTGLPNPFSPTSAVCFQSYGFLCSSN